MIQKTIDLIGALCFIIQYAYLVVDAFLYYMDARIIPSALLWYNKGGDMTWYIESYIKSGSHKPFVVLDNKNVYYYMDNYIADPNLNRITPEDGSVYINTSSVRFKIYTDLKFRFFLYENNFIFEWECYGKNNEILRYYYHTFENPEELRKLEQYDYKFDKMFK